MRKEILCRLSKSGSWQLGELDEKAVFLGICEYAWVPLALSAEMEWNQTYIHTYTYAYYSTLLLLIFKCIYHSPIIINTYYSASCFILPSPYLISKQIYLNETYILGGLPPSYTPTFIHCLN